MSETDRTVTQSPAQLQAQPLRVALLGCGVVGSAVARLLTENAGDLRARIGRPLEIVGVAVRRPDKDRSETGVDASLFTQDAAGLVTRADVVIEVIGGIEPARTLILSAMEHGASVVTANKALLAEDGPRLYQAAQDRNVDLYYEASVAGAIPLLRPLRESLVGDDVHRILGIVNGTTNYVLDKMDTTGAGFADAVEQAQALGYLPADQTLKNRASTPQPRPRSWPRWRSTPGSQPGTCIARASPRSAPRTSTPRARWTVSSSCWPSASASRTIRRRTAATPGAASRCACIPR